MVPTFDAAARIDGAALGGEDVLPAPRARRERILAGKRRRQPYIAETFSDVLFVKLVSFGKMRAQCAANAAWQHGDAVLPPLAIANEYLAPGELNVFHP